MSYRFDISDSSFKDFLLDIKSYFEKNKNTIHKARNELKIITYDDKDTVVKAFRVPNIINQFAYSYIRGSKAKKSYQNGMKLIKLGINTPTPIGYIEFYKYTLLKKSYFISRHQPYDFLIREPLYDKNFSDRESIIKQFATFTYSLHQKNVYHRDYSAGNTLVIDNKDGTYTFSIVDINRMEFRSVDINLAMENFNKLWADESALSIIAYEYARVSGYNQNKCKKLILSHDKRLKEFVESRRRWKKRIFKR